MRYQVAVHDAAVYLDNVFMGVSDAINWTSNAAVDFWGPVWANKEFQASITANFVAVRQLYLDGDPASVISIHCDDPSRTCSLDRGGIGQGVVAYAETDADGNAMIALCPNFWDIPSRMDNGAALDQDTEMQKNMDYMRNQGNVFLHEIMHLELISQDRPKSK